MVIVKLTAALICFLGQCYPALVGTHTPVGEFPLVWMATKDPGYGGDVLVFAQDTKGYYAIHRVWLLDPAQHRNFRIKSDDPEIREITNGCVNVTPVVYEKLINCCTRDRLEILR